jgi:hypothetical protein
VIRPLISLSLALVLVAMMATTALTADAEVRVSDDPLDIVYVESAAIHLPSDDRAGATLVVSGSLPTACHHPAFEVEHASDLVRVWLWSVLEADSPCAAAPGSLELTIPLGVIDPEATVLLEGELVTQVVEVEGRAPAELVGAGWSFGMCLGYCAAELQLDDGTAVLSGYDREREDPIFVNQGVLTAEGLERVAVAVAALDPTGLEPMYGCPDCSDGGASHLLLDQGGIVSRLDMELDAPPDSLAAAQETAREIMDALEMCDPNELITVAPDCRAYLRDPA